MPSGAAAKFGVSASSGPPAAASHEAGAIAPKTVVNYELLFDCVHCGLCLESCPSYAITRSEADSPRGRIYLMKALAEGSLGLEQSVVHHLDLCLGCFGCETACPSGVHYGSLVEDARAHIELNWRRPVGERILRWIIAAVLPFPNRLSLMLSPLKLLEWIGLRPAAAKMLPRRMSWWLSLLPPLSLGRPAPLLGKAGSDGSEEGPAVTVHPGCVTRVLADSANRNTQWLLRSAGYNAQSIEAARCCGALDLHLGNRARALAFARANVSSLSRARSRWIISAASGCAAMIAGYGELLKEDSEICGAAQEVSAKVSDLSTLLQVGGFKPKGGLRCVVTYHESCHLAHRLGVHEAPRELLRSVPGVELVEMEEPDLCCGSGGVYNVTQPEVAGALARRKVDHILATGADYVVMSNPACEFQIAAELRRRKARVRALQMPDFLALVASAGG